jgi:hypothetical protein
VAKPDLEDGYLRLAHELFAAVCCAGLNKWEMIVLREVFDQIYGPRKAPTAFLYPTDIARRWGTFKESIVRAIRSMVDAGILRRRAEAEVAFVKDYEKWSRGGKPRLSTAEIGRCMASKKGNASMSLGNNGAPNHQSDPLDTGTNPFPKQADASKSFGNESVPIGSESVPDTGTDPFPTGSAVVPENGLCVDRPPAPPLCERPRDVRAKNELRIKREGKTEELPSLPEPCPERRQGEKKRAGSETQAAIDRIRSNRRKDA